MPIMKQMKKVLCSILIICLVLVNYTCVYAAIGDDSEDEILINAVKSITIANVPNALYESDEARIQAILEIDDIYKDKFDERCFDLIVWSSSNEDVVYFRYGYGMSPTIAASSPGTATIYCTVGSKVASANISVKGYEEDDENTEITDHSKGEIIKNKAHLFQYINYCLSNGIYDIYFSDKSPYKITSAVLQTALELNDEYLYREITDPVYKNGKLYSYNWSLGTFVHAKDNRIVEYHMNKNAKDLIEEVNKKADTILNSILKDDMTDIEKTTAILKYLTPDCTVYRIIQGDDKIPIIGAPYNYMPYNTLLKKECVPIGMARTFNLLMRKAGIPCMRIGEGDRVGGLLGDTPYNVARINGKLYYFDLNYPFNNSGASTVSEKRKKELLKLRFSDSYLQPYKKFIYNGNPTTRLRKWDEKKYNTSYLNYVCTSSNPSLSKISVSESLTLSRGKEKLINISVPTEFSIVSKFTNKNNQIKISYKTKKPQIATVSSSGKISGKKKGTTKIIITLKMQDGTKKTYNTKVTVK